MGLAEAIRFAALKHGQARDKGGQPFIGHPLRVMATIAAEYPDAPEVVLEAAVLHDVVEDTNVDMQEIRQRFDRKIALMVDLLTRKDHETYWDYIGRIATAGTIYGEFGEWAKRIKLADIHDNLNPARRVEGMKLPERYERAMKILTS